MLTFNLSKSIPILITSWLLLFGSSTLAVVTVYGNIRVGDDQALHVSARAALIHTNNPKSTFQSVLVQRNGDFAISNVKPGNYQVVLIDYMKQSKVTSRTDMHLIDNIQVGNDDIYLETFTFNRVDNYDRREELKKAPEQRDEEAFGAEFDDKEWRNRQSVPILESQPYEEKSRELKNRDFRKEYSK